MKYTGAFLELSVLFIIILSCIQLVISILSLHVSVLERKCIWFCPLFPHQCQMAEQKEYPTSVYIIHSTPYQCTVPWLLFVLNNVISNLVATVISFLQSICLPYLKLWGWSVLHYNKSVSINIFTKKRKNKPKKPQIPQNCTPSVKVI